MLTIMDEIFLVLLPCCRIKRKLNTIDYLQRFPERHSPIETERAAFSGFSDHLRENVYLPGENYDIRAFDKG